jgi:formamidopyrimidine-DNA glycosylase
MAARLIGRRVERLARRAKYILMYLDDETVLIAHLGMSGRMVIERDASPPGRHDHVIFETEDGVRIVFNDPRRFGSMDLSDERTLDQHPLLRDIGPEPLSNSFNAPALTERLAGRKTAIKAALLDQRIVAGLGNIYVCEALYRSRVSPRRTAGTIAGKRAEKLVDAIRAVLTEAIEAGGSSLRDYVRADGELGYFQHQFDVYGREGEACVDCTCKGGIKRIVQGGRSTFFCSTRQR